MIDWKVFTDQLLNFENLTAEERCEINEGLRRDQVAWNEKMDKLGFSCVARQRPVTIESLRASTTREELLEFMATLKSEENEEAVYENRQTH